MFGLQHPAIYQPVACLLDNEARFNLSLVSHELAELANLSLHSQVQEKYQRWSLTLPKLSYACLRILDRYFDEVTTIPRRFAEHSDMEPATTIPWPYYTLRGLQVLPLSVLHPLIIRLIDIFVAPIAQPDLCLDYVRWARLIEVIHSHPDLPILLLNDEVSFEKLTTLRSIHSNSYLDSRAYNKKTGMPNLSLQSFPIPIKYPSDLLENLYIESVQTSSLTIFNYKDSLSSHFPLVGFPPTESLRSRISSHFPSVAPLGSSRYTRRISHLRHLSLTYANLKRVPVELNQFEDLVELDLSHNQLESFELTVLPQLMALNLSHNQLHAFPSAVLRFPELTSLDVSENPLVDREDSIQDRSKTARDTCTTKLRSLKLRNCQLKLIPPILKSKVTGYPYARLLELDVSHNQLTKLDLPSLVDTRFCQNYRGKYVGVTVAGWDRWSQKVLMDAQVNAAYNQLKVVTASQQLYFTTLDLRCNQLRNFKAPCKVDNLYLQGNPQ